VQRRRDCLLQQLHRLVGLAALLHKARQGVQRHHIARAPRQDLVVAGLGERKVRRVLGGVGAELPVQVGLGLGAAGAADERL